MRGWWTDRVTEGKREKGKRKANIQSMFPTCFCVTAVFVIQEMSHTDSKKREMLHFHSSELTHRKGLQLFPTGNREVAPFSSKLSLHMDN